MALAAFLPLAFNISDTSKVYGVTKSLLTEGSKFMGASSEIGIGIASIFILIYTFRFGRQLIEGGKFSTQMLLPYLIYLLVCNFSWVSRPVVSFTSTLQSSVVHACYGSSGDGTTLMESFMSARDAWLKSENPEYDAAFEEFQKAKEGDDLDTESTESSADGKKSTGILKGLGARIRTEIVKAYEWIKKRALESMYFSTSTVFNSLLNYGLAALLCLVLQWVATAVSVAMQCFGGIVVAILVAFGPLTWSFALLPDNTGVIKSWFIRLCQFSLYSPICSLINAFTFTICQELAKMDLAKSSILMLFCILVCNIFALFQTGAIATMIIEGASGGASIGGGVSAISQVFTATAAIGEPLRDKASMAKQDQQNQYLERIANAVDPQPSDESASGQNPMS